MKKDSESNSNDNICNSVEAPTLPASTKRLRSSIMKSLLSGGIPVRLQSVGFSMRPFIRKNDIIVVGPTSRDSISPGKVVVFSFPQGETLHAHRVLKIFPQAFLIKGDRVKKTDGLIPWENIHGEVISIIRGGRTRRVGLGPEGRVIAWFSYSGLLFRCYEIVSRLRKRLRCLWR